MALETGTYVGDLDATNPVGATDKRHQGDDHLRLIKSLLKATFPNATKPFRFPTILSKSANYTILSSDDNATILCTTTSAGFTLTLPTLASGDAGWTCRAIKITSDANAVTLSGTINNESGMSSTTQYEVITILWTGTAWNAWVGSNGLKVTAVTDNLTVTENHLDGLILSTPSGANKTLTLPAVASYNGRMLTIVHSGNTYKTTLDGNASETINGATTYDLNYTNAAIQLIATSSGWVGLESNTSANQLVAASPATGDYLTGYDISAAKLAKFLVSDILALVSGVPSGTISAYGGTTEPSGWLFCYGQAISRTTYAALFTAISTTYGVGDGSTTFNLPDLRGRVVAGQDDMGGTSADRLTGASGGVDGDVLGGTGGAETHTLIIAEMPAHTHGIVGKTAGTGTFTNTGANTTNNTNNTNSEGGGGAHNNVQPTIILNYIIKT